VFFGIRVLSIGIVEPMNDETRFSEVFYDDVPECVLCLKYSLGLLKQDSSQLSITTIKLIYSVFIDECETHQRKAFLGHIVDKIESAQCNPVALLVFIRYDPHPEIIHLAVSGYLQHRRSSIDDPFVAARDTLSILNNGDVANRGALLAALVCFGDRRICLTVRSTWDSITPEEAIDFSKAITKSLYRATLEFFVTWLVHLRFQERYEVMMPVASAFSSMLTSQPIRTIRDRQYNFGPYGFASAQSLPEVAISNLLVEMAPLIDLLSGSGVPELNEVIETLRDYSYSNGPDAIEQDHAATSRELTERRVNDRRLAATSPRFERRVRQRRSGTRSVTEYPKTLRL
jgi:hypothetical protein